MSKRTTKKKAEVAKPNPAFKKPEVAEISKSEKSALEDIMGLTMNRAYVEALNNGASVAGVSKTSKLGNVDALPTPNGKQR